MSSNKKITELPQLPGSQPDAVDLLAIVDTSLNLTSKMQVSMLDARYASAVQGNPNAIVNPTLNDDNTLGYAVGSYWFNALTTTLFIAQSVGTGSANWKQVLQGQGLLAKSAINPTVNEDNTLGFKSGSFWFNTVTSSLFICNTAGTGAAVWVNVTGVGAGGLITATYAAIQTLIAGSLLAPGAFYKISDKADLGIIIQALTTNTFSQIAVADFLNADWQFVGNYTGVITQTTIAAGATLGQWSPSLTPSLGDIVIWQPTPGSSYWGHYQNLTGAVGTAPDGDATNWVLLLKASANVGYIEIWNEVEYDFTSDAILSRTDSVYNNYVRVGSPNFLWGNQFWNTCRINAAFNGTITGINSGLSDIVASNITLNWSGDGIQIHGCLMNHDFTSNVTGNNFTVGDTVFECCTAHTISGDNCVFLDNYFGNSRTVNFSANGSQINGSTLLGYGDVNDNGLTTVIQSCMFSSQSFFNMNGFNLTSCNFSTNAAFLFNIVASHVLETYDSGFSSMSADLDAAANWVLGVLTIPTGYGYLGVINLTTAAGGAISNLVGEVPDANPFRFINANAIVNTITPIAVAASVTAGDILSDGGSVVLAGRASGSDFYEFIKSGTKFMKNNVVALV